jgi:23S rRNA (cytosine1962-C5)-methyltransferase
MFEDEHLLVVDKPAGLNTHAPSPYAGEGLYDWLRHREPRWAALAIIHRLDKETSGLMVFGKTPLANRSLTAQFAARSVHKIYQLRTDRRVPVGEQVVSSGIARAGDHYVSSADGEPAETHFRWLSDGLVQAQPLTGRTHQIRVHAAASGFPILGDTLYGGSAWPRVCLHAAELRFAHPASGELLSFNAPADFLVDARQMLRTALIDAGSTTACRLIHGASDGWPGWYLDRLGEVLVSQSAGELSAEALAYLAAVPDVKAVYHKRLNRQVRRTTPEEASPQLLSGEPLSAPFTILENGLRFEMSMLEGYSTGLFLDQRDNRRRLLSGHVAAGFPLRDATTGGEFSLLNTFAYSCGFSVCAAQGGAHTTSLDLSKKYLEWGRRNFRLNGLDPVQHDFVYGDVFDWLRRFAKKSRQFDVIVLDPPTFSQSKAQGMFRATQDYGRLVDLALPLLKPGGVLLAASNAANWLPEDFIAGLEAAVHAGGRRILKKHYVPQPPDFPLSRAEPAFLKSVWLQIARDAPPERY